jgi:hypothetical protein
VLVNLLIQWRHGMHPLIIVRRNHSQRPGEA